MKKDLKSVIKLNEGIYVTNLMNMGRTPSMPKSALRYEMDKARYLDLETCSNPVLFSQN